MCPASGLAVAHALVAVESDSIYRMYSMTKPIVSAALMQLVEEGRLQLSDPLHLYLGDGWKKRRMSVFVQGDAEPSVSRSTEWVKL